MAFTIFAQLTYALRGPKPDKWGFEEPLTFFETAVVLLHLMVSIYIIFRIIKFFYNAWKLFSSFFRPAPPGSGAVYPQKNPSKNSRRQSPPVRPMSQVSMPGNLAIRIPPTSSIALESLARSGVPANPSRQRRGNTYKIPMDTKIEIIDGKT
jgi:hypothetical protein